MPDILDPTGTTAPELDLFPDNMDVFPPELFTCCIDFQTTKLFWFSEAVDLRQQQKIFQIILSGIYR